MCARIVRQAELVAFLDADAGTFIANDPSEHEARVIAVIEWTTSRADYLGQAGARVIDEVRSPSLSASRFGSGSDPARASQAPRRSSKISRHDTRPRARSGAGRRSGAAARVIVQEHG
jgi:hypothetical protein